jgi:phosphomevalonate decarboxylase
MQDDRVDMKRTAIAHPIQGLIKYHGLKDELLKIPFHDSISVCTEPTSTRTTVEFGTDFKKDEVMVDDQLLDGREKERVELVLEKVRQLAGSNEGCKVVSVNDFRSNVGLGASASGFAALAVAASAALELKLSIRELSSLARLGAGSASRSVTGGFSRWYGGTGHDDSYSAPLASDSELPMGIVVAVIPAYKQTLDIHKDAVTSPFFHSRLAYIHEALAQMETAIRERNVPRIGMLAERDTLILHGITMTGEDEAMLWRPETLKVMAEVRRMRDDGVPAYFSIDTGATVYINTLPDKVGLVEGHIKDLGIETLRCGVGGKAELLSDHLF